MRNKEYSMLIKYKTEPTIIVLSPNSANLIKILTQFVYSINIRYFSPPPLPCPVTLQGITYKIGAEAKGKYISSSAVPRSITGCFVQQNIGEVSARTEGLIKQRGLEYKQEHNPRFRLYRAVKSQGRRREKGEDCLSGASSAAPPDGDRSDKPKSPITAAALSLTGKESPLYPPTQPYEQKKTAPFRKHKRIKRELKNRRK